MTPYDRPKRQKRRQFGETWWGKEWVEAVEQRASLDPNRLARGRTYARWNYVGALQVEPGVVRARVAGSRATPYHTHVKIKVFTDTQWNAFLDVVSGKVAHAAALLDSELSFELAEDARLADIDLLPAADDLDMGCSCPDETDTCKHATAICYLIADLLDDDPFALLHMRGRTKETVIDGLRRRRQRTSEQEALARASEQLQQVSAQEVFVDAEVGPLPRVPIAPDRPGQPPKINDLPENSAVEVGDLEFLARATAQRAWEMCSGIGDSGLHDPPYRDFVRRMVPLLDTVEFDTLCSRSKYIRSSVEIEARRSIADDDDARDDNE